MSDKRTLIRKVRVPLCNPIVHGWQHGGACMRLSRSSGAFALSSSAQAAAWALGAGCRAALPLLLPRFPLSSKLELLDVHQNSGWLTWPLAEESPPVPGPPPLRAPHTRAASCAGGSPSAEQGTGGGAGGGAGAALACLQATRTLWGPSMHGRGCQTQMTVCCSCMQPWHVCRQTRTLWSAHSLAEVSRHQGQTAVADDEAGMALAGLQAVGFGSAWYGSISSWQGMLWQEPACPCQKATGQQRLNKLQKQQQRITKHQLGWCPCTVHCAGAAAC